MDKLKFKKTHLPYNRNIDALANPAYQALALLDKLNFEKLRITEWHGFLDHATYFLFGLAVFCNMCTWGLALSAYLYFFIKSLF